ncbi:MAG TPA: MtrB/PioB family outer membrane beta-barrel protein, partial [Vicinamibacteria bacterium]|nr:MtrB/PioB family outer membrane beta-barrel protein [Vicinamibacteria bacterium]
MKRNFILAIAVSTLGLPALAQEDFQTGEMTFGVLQKDPDTDSSKFLEYRDIPQGAVAPYFNVQGRKGSFWYTLTGRDVTQRDQRYLFKLQNDNVKLTADYTGIPHNFGNGGKSILSPVTENEWRLSNTVQQAYQTAIVAQPPSPIGQIDYNCQRRPGFNPLPTCFSLFNLVTPGLDAAPPNIDLKLVRNRGTYALNFTPDSKNLDLNLTYLHERRSGTRAANGTSFGFGNVVETPEPLRYITQDVAFTAAYKGDWGVARAAVRFNDFKNSFDTFTWDNPFRVTDSTDPSAYQSPSTSTRNGPSHGAMALMPDNQATTEMVGATLKIGKKTRLSADVTLGQLKQNEDPLLAWTTNTAILTPGGVPAVTAPLPATTLDGSIDTTALNGFFTTKLTDELGLHARYRRYDHDNKTPRYRLEQGYVRFDAVWEDIPRITVPYGYTNDLFDAYATYNRGAFGLEGGWKHNKMARTFRETEDTTEDVFRVAADVRSGIFMVRGLGEFGSRDFDHYGAVHAEEHSFLEPGAPANQTVLRRPDQAKRDLTRFGGQLELAPESGKFALFASYLHTKFEYDQAHVECEDIALFPTQAAFCPGGEQAPLGLIDDQYDSFSIDANFAPSEKFNLYAFYTWEDGDILQNGRQSGSSLNFAVNDVWTANITTKGNTFGGG